MSSPRFLPGLNQNRFNNPHQMPNQRPQRPRPPPPSLMNRPPQLEREPQSSHPTSGPFAGQHSRPPPPAQQPQPPPPLSPQESQPEKHVQETRPPSPFDGSYVDAHLKKIDE